MHRKAFLALAVVCYLASSAFAVSTISLGQTNYVVNPGTTGNVIEVFVSGPAGNKFQGLDLTMTSNDGLTGPIFTDADLQTADDTLFHGVSNPQQVLPLPDRLLYASVLTINESTTVGPSGLLGRVYFSTVGVEPGVYPVLLDYLGLPPNLAGLAGDGQQMISTDQYTITVVPEPSSIVLGGAGVVGLAFVAIRRRRGRKTA